MNPELKKIEIQKKLKELALILLDNSETFFDFSEEDFVNATMIFNALAQEAAYKYTKPIGFEAQLRHAQTYGKALRDLIIDATGKDMHVVMRRLIDKSKK